MSLSFNLWRLNDYRSFAKKEEKIGAIVIEPIANEAIFLSETTKAFAK